MIMSLHLQVFLFEYNTLFVLMCAHLSHENIFGVFLMLVFRNFNLVIYSQKLSSVLTIKAQVYGTQVLFMTTAHMVKNTWIKGNIR